jgi:uncharacterized repeat protein (TIGR02543 family)
MLFSFAALSIARAVPCSTFSDFEILANGKTINAPSGNSTVSYSIMIGENLEFTVSPVGDVILWTLPQAQGVTVNDLPSYSPPISLAATGNIEGDMLLRVKNCGIEKTIVIKLKARPYKVIFDQDNGSDPTQQELMPGEFVTEPTPPPIKTGYEFVRWEMPVGTAYDFSSPVNNDITIKAAWIPKTYMITFDPQGGDVSPENQTVTYDAPVGILPEPTRAGYDFSGWYKTKTGGTEYTSATLYKNEGPITLYAKWTPKKYTITFDVDCSDGTVNPESQLVTYNAPVGTLPKPTRAAHKFIGWFSAPIDGDEYTSATLYPIEGPTTLYARWEFIKGTRPVKELLEFTIPSGLAYIGAEITSLPTASQKDGTYGKLGDMTILYNGKETLPKDAGTYAISVFIDKDISEDYDTATVSLGPMTIAKASATASVTSATVKSKIYDADTFAEIDDLNFSISPLYADDEISRGDYVINASFASSDVGTGIAVNGTINWHPNGPLSKNYTISPSPLTFTTTASITQATGDLRIIAAPPYDIGKSPFYKYTYSEGYANPAVDKNHFIPDNVIIFEYKRDGEKDDAYSTYRPNRVGNWFVRAKLPTTTNYTGDMDSILFKVERGDAKLVKHEIEIPEDSEDYFTEDSDLSGESRTYYVANVCDSERNDSIKITVTEEPDIVLKLGINSLHRQGDESQGYYYKIPFNFGKPGFSKPGLDTLIYTLASTDNIYKEYDTLLIETPIAFDSIAKQKWNNVIFINNNPKDNGGYEFTDFKWFKNDKAIDSLQFYSAGPRSTDVLKQSDAYKVTMHTKDGIRISTCDGNPKKITVIPAAATEKPAVAKRVLGINGKTAKPEQKVYNAYGAERKNTPAGVYIVKDE